MFSLFTCTVLIREAPIDRPISRFADSEQILLLSAVVLGGIPVHTEYRCLFFLWYEFLKYCNTGVI